MSNRSGEVQLRLWHVALAFLLFGLAVLYVAHSIVDSICDAVGC